MKTTAILGFNRYCSVFIAGLLLGFVPAAHASTPSTPSLAELVRQGLALNPRVKSADAEVGLAKQNVTFNEGRYWPSLQLSAGPADGISGAFAYNATLSYTLYDWGALDHQIASLNAESRKAFHRLREVRSEVGLEIVEAYLDIMAARHSEELAKDYRTRVRGVAEIALNRAKGGFSDKAEASRALQARYHAQQELQNARNEQAQAEIRLRVLLQQPVGALPPLPRNLESVTRLIPSTQNAAELVSRSPQYMQAKEQVQVALSGVNQAEAEQKPKLVIEAASQRRNIGGELIRDSSVALRVTGSIDYGLATFDSDKAERLRAEAADWELQFIQLDIQRSIDMQRKQIENFVRQLKTIDEQVNSIDLTIDAYEGQFSSGFITIQELLSAERERYELLIYQSATVMEALRVPYRLGAELGILDSMLAKQSDRASF